MSLVEPTLTEKRLARVPANDAAAQAIENVIVRGDLKALTADQRNTYYVKLCDLMGLNPMTQPFEYLTLNGKLVLYAKKACTDQLRAVHRISVVDMDQEEREGLYTVTVKVQNGEGRTDMDIGSVNVKGLTGEHRANAIMKASTKAKRRATLSICGLGLLDETEVETGGDDPDPMSPPRQQPTINPATGRTIDPNSARQQKMNGTWDSFVDKARGFDDLNALEEWWAKATTQAAIDALAPGLRTGARFEYEQQQERLADKLKAELDAARQQ